MLIPDIAALNHITRFIEATVSIIVSSMPSAAKIWNRHIVGSAMYAFLSSKLGTTDSKHIEPLGLPLDLEEAKAKAEKKRRRGLFSLPSFLTSGFSAVRATQSTEKPTLDTFRADLEQRIEGPERFSLHLNDLSGYIERTNTG